MTVVFIIALVVVLLFGFVVIFGAPYLPTMSRQTEDALELLDLKTGQTLLELGSGDGRVLLAAAKRNLKAVGYEINPLLVIVSKLVTWRYRQQVKVVWGSYWSQKWEDADGIYVFLLDKFMKKLDKKIIQEFSRQRSDTSQKKIKLVSYAFAIPNKKSTNQKGPLYLYEYDFRG